MYHKKKKGAGQMIFFFQKYYFIVQSFLRKYCDGFITVVIFRAMRHNLEKIKLKTASTIWETNGHKFGKKINSISRL